MVFSLKSAHFREEGSYLQVSLCCRGVFCPLALPLGFSHRVPACHLVLLSGASRGCCSGRQSCSDWEVFWWRCI